MNAHKGLTRLQLLKYPAEKIGLMVASEFLRASDKAKYPQIVRSSFARAKELMGVLETTDLTPTSAAYLQPYYGRCTEAQLRVSEQTSPEELRAFCLELAHAFEAAFNLPKGNTHA